MTASPELATRETELERALKAGDPRALLDLARTLCEGQPLRAAFDDEAEHAAVRADTPAADAFRQVALGRLAQVAGNARTLRRVRSPGALHQTRVGLRALRAALSAFKPLLDREGLGRLEAQARWLAGELDTARELDVFIHETWRPAAEAAVEEDFALAALGGRLLEAQGRAYDRALAALDSPRFAALLLEATAWIQAGDWARRDDPVLQALRERPLSSFGAEALDRLRKRVVKRGHGLRHLDPDRRHKLRIKAKALRYAADFLGEAWGGEAGKPRREFMAALKALLDSLGELNDLAMAADTARAAAGPRAPDLAFAAGLIVGRSRAREAALLNRAAKAYRAFRKAAPFWKA